MARTVRDTKLETRNARLKLPKRKEPYWKNIDKGLHIGYYKGSNGGSWLARYRNNKKKYTKTTLGLSDDVSDSDNVTIFTFSEAQEKAREWFSLQGKAEAGLENYSGKYKVSDAAADYLKWFKQNRKSYNETNRAIEKYILPEFGTIQVEKLTTKRIRYWMEKMVSTPAELRSGKLQKPKFKEVDNDPETVRKRKSTTNRILTMLKAMLNHAYKEGVVADDGAWRRVKPFEKVDAPKICFLTKAEVKRLLNVIDTDFKLLVQAALLTDARYAELSNLTCADFHADSETLYLCKTKNGKPRYIHLNKSGTDFFTTAIAGRPSSDVIFTNAGKKWQKSQQTRRTKEACKKARIEPAVSFHILRHTYASHLVMAGTPLNVVAVQLGHSDTRICERHYAHLSPNYIKQTIKANMPSFNIEYDSNITPMVKN